MLKLKPMLVLFICWSIVSWLACSTVSSVQRVLVGSAEELLSEDELRLRTPAARNHSHTCFIFSHISSKTIFWKNQTTELSLVLFKIHFFTNLVPSSSREKQCVTILIDISRIWSLKYLKIFYIFYTFYTFYIFCSIWKYIFTGTGSTHQSAHFDISK